MYKKGEIRVHQLHQNLLLRSNNFNILPYLLLSIYPFFSELFEDSLNQCDPWLDYRKSGNDIVVM